MPMYTFYPCLADGTATSFEAFELHDDAAAYRRGQMVLQGHASATHVTIWHGRRILRPIRRETEADVLQGVGGARA